MPGNVLGLFYSLALIAFSFVISLLFEHYCKAPFASAVARKIVHIGVSNWYFIYLHCFDNFIYPVAGLLGFAALNLIKELNDRQKGKGSTSWGTVEFPLIVSALVILVQLGLGTKQMLGCALLGMGYGDGLAAVFGTVFKGPAMPWNRKKTVIGSLVCFVVVSLAVYLVANLSPVICLAVGLITMLVEAYTPFNLDNITVPAVIFVLVRFL